MIDISYIFVFLKLVWFIGKKVDSFLSLKNMELKLNNSRLEKITNELNGLSRNKENMERARNERDLSFCKFTTINYQQNVSQPFNRIICSRNQPVSLSRYVSLRIFYSPEIT